MHTIIAHIEDPNQLKIVKDFLKSLKIKVETTDQDDPYFQNPKIIESLKRSIAQAERGELVEVEMKDLDKFLGL